jgi:AcrR family transcriptional regulator
VDVEQLNPGRSTLPKNAARQRYVEIGEIVALEQIQLDAAELDRQAIAIGPFARLDAGSVAARDGKTRGAITNLFGSQATFQAETMALALSASDWIERLTYPDPADHSTAEEWLDVLLTGESDRGPRHGAEPASDYGFLWALWLSTVPYGLWSEYISQVSMDEHVLWIEKLDRVLTTALEHFGRRLRDGTTVTDLATALANAVEGAWLNQCLTARHPGDPGEPIATAVRRSGLMLWRGAVADLAPSAVTSPAVATR